MKQLSGDSRGIFAAVLLLCVSGACAIPQSARTADVLRPGEFQLGGYIGGSFGSEMQPDTIPLEVIWNYGLSGRVGIPGICDVGADLSPIRQGANFRCGVLNERRGAPLSIAPVIGAAYLPTRGAEWSAGLDVGTTIKGSVKPLLNLSYSQGPHWVFSESSQLRHIEQSHYDRRVRQESRVSATVGAAFVPSPSDSPGTWLLVSATPYWIVNPVTPLGSAPGFSGVTWSVGALAELGGPGK